MRVRTVHEVSGVADPGMRDPVPFRPLDLGFESGIRDGKNPDLGSGMNIRDNFSKSLETVFRVTSTKII
jgi:hypothetical protein